MRRSILFLAVILFARENPFELPKSPSSSAAVQQSQPAKQLQAQKTSSSQADKEQVAKEVQSTPIAAKMQKVADFGFLRVYLKDNLLRLNTKDTLRRSFIIENPKKAVFDFTAKRRFASKTALLNKGPFKKVAIGAHKKFYRIAIEVNESCKPKINALELICR